MKIIIDVDYREKKLIKFLNILQKDFNYSHLEINTKDLPLGDIIISKTNKLNEKKELMIIERKNLNDLASSIRDGRYKEQSYRLSNTGLHNHNIVYLIEGNIATWSNRYTKIEPKTIYVTMFCIQYYKGLSLIHI